MSYEIDAAQLWNKVKNHDGQLENVTTELTSKANQSDLNLTNANVSANAASLAELAKQFGTAPPTNGTWQLADKVWNTSPVSGGIVGWICIQAGTFGNGNDPVFKEFGIISS